MDHKRLPKYFLLGNNLERQTDGHTWSACQARDDWSLIERPCQEPRPLCVKNLVQPVFLFNPFSVSHSRGTDSCSEHIPCKCPEKYPETFVRKQVDIRKPGRWSCQGSLELRWMDRSDRLMGLPVYRSTRLAFDALVQPMHGTCCFVRMWCSNVLETYSFSFQV